MNSYKNLCSNIFRGIIFSVSMIKESIKIIFALTFMTSFCEASSIEYESGIELGDWGMPLISRANSYDSLD